MKQTLNYLYWFSANRLTLNESELKLDAIEIEFLKKYD